MLIKICRKEKILESFFFKLNPVSFFCKSCGFSDKLTEVTLNAFRLIISEFNRPSVNGDQTRNVTLLEQKCGQLFISNLTVNGAWQRV